MIADDLNRYFRLAAPTEDHRRAYEENGFVKVGPTLTEEGVASMTSQAMSAWTAEKGEFDPEGTWLNNALLTDVHRKSDLCRAFYMKGPLVDWAEALIGPNIKGVTSQLTFKMRGNTKPFGWHQDNQYGELDPYNALTTLTALDDADEENGCLWIIPGSHRHGQLSPGLTAAEKQKGGEVNAAADEAAAVPVRLKAGESVVFHCWTLHKSEGNHSRSRDRRIVFFRYADADAVEVYNERRPRRGPLIRGVTAFPNEVQPADAPSGVS